MYQVSNRTMRVYNFILAGACALLFLSCNKKDDPTDSDLGYSYYPIEEGDYSVYDVVDSSFQGVGINVVTKYQLKEEIHEPITVGDEVRYQVYVYYKTTGMDDWNSYPDSVWTVLARDNLLIVLLRT